MMLKQTVLMLALLTGVTGFANTNDFIAANAVQGKIQASMLSNDNLDTLKVLSEQNQSENKTLIATLMTQATSGLPDKKQPQAADGALLFVSFSMPEPLLFALADEAAAFNIPVVLNGLVDGDFKKTVDTFARLTKVASKQRLNFQGLSIDPVWFEQFHITSVPALVVTTRPALCEAQRVCANQPFDVVYGNASVHHGLQLIADRGEAAPKLAALILEQGHV